MGKIFVLGNVSLRFKILKAPTLVSSSILKIKYFNIVTDAKIIQDNLMIGKDNQSAN